MALTSKQRTAIYDKKHPHKNRWFKLRYRAGKRNIVFDILYEDFRDFCNDRDVEGRTGRTKECLSFDRIDSKLGYSKGNLQILTVSDNSSKGTKEMGEWTASLIPEEFKLDEGECPF